MSTSLEHARASVHDADIALVGLLQTLASGRVGCDAGLPEELALIASARVTSRDARMLLAIRDSLTHMPATASLVASGVISFSQIKAISFEVRALTVAQKQDVDAYISDVAPDLADADADALVDQVGFEVARLTAPKLAKRDQRILESEFVWIQPDLDGGAKLFAQMSQDLASTVLEALDGAADRPDDGTPRGVQRAHALGRICEATLSGAGGGTARARIHVTCDIKTLTDGADAGRMRWRLPGTTPTLSPELTQMLACDAEIIPMLFRGTEPLSYGPTHRTIPERVRQAVLTRDAGCRWPGHETPTAWCDVHHTQPGNHDPSTLITLCRPCHRRAHLQRWTITPNGNGGFAFRRGRVKLSSIPRGIPLRR